MRYILFVLTCFAMAWTPSKAMDLDTCSFPINYYLDLDNDGFGNNETSLILCNPISQYTLNGDDCQDNDALIFPGANEVCDYVDNNCDGEIDEYVQSSFYMDNDSDGFGNSDEVLLDCNQPLGYVSNSDDCDDNLILFLDADQDGYGSFDFAACGEPLTGDCNDNSDSIFPFQTEVCNDIDDNCNDEVDEFVLNTYYLDNDADGFGDANQTLYACQSEIGYINNNLDCDDSLLTYEDLDADGYGSNVSAPCGVEFNTDCDDLNDNINPNASEIPDNLIDENCDGEVSTNISENKAMNLQLFPNPANQWITISANQSSSNNKLIIVNQLGQKMFTGIIERSMQLNVGNWANGIYNIIIGTETESFLISR